MFPAPAPTTELPPQQNSAPPDGEAAKAKAREMKSHEAEVKAKALKEGKKTDGDSPLKPVNVNVPQVKQPSQKADAKGTPKAKQKGADAKAKGKPAKAKESNVKDQGKGGKQGANEKGAKGDIDAEVRDYLAKAPKDESKREIHTNVKQLADAASNLAESAPAPKAPDGAAKSALKALVPGADTVMAALDGDKKAMADSDLGKMVGAGENPYDQFDGVLKTWGGKIYRVRNFLSGASSLLGKVGTVLTVIGVLISITGIGAPLGAPIATIGRVLGVITLVMDAINFILSGILTGLLAMELAKEPPPDPAKVQKLAGQLLEESANTFQALLSVGMALPGVQKLAGLVVGGAGKIASGLTKMVGKFLGKVGAGAAKGLGKMIAAGWNKLKTSVFKVTALKSGPGFFSKVGNVAKAGLDKGKALFTKGKDFVGRTGSKLIDKINNKLELKVRKFEESAFGKGLRSVDKKVATPLNDFMDKYTGKTLLDKAEKSAGYYATKMADKVDGWGTKLGDGTEGLLNKGAGKVEQSAQREAAENLAKQQQKEAEKRALEEAAQKQGQGVKPGDTNAPKVNEPAPKVDEPNAPKADEPAPPKADEPAAPKADEPKPGDDWKKYQEKRQKALKRAEDMEKKHAAAERQRVYDDAKDAAATEKSKLRNLEKRQKQGDASVTDDMIEAQKQKVGQALDRRSDAAEEFQKAQQKAQQKEVESQATDAASDRATRRQNDNRGGKDADGNEAKGLTDAEKRSSSEFADSQSYKDPNLETPGSIWGEKVGDPRMISKTKDQANNDSKADAERRALELLREQTGDIADAAHDNVVDHVTAPSVPGLDDGGGGGDGGLFTEIHGMLGSIDEDPGAQKNDEQDQDKDESDQIKTDNKGQKADDQGGGDQPKGDQPKGDGDAGAGSQKPGAIPYWPELLEEYQQDLATLGKTREALQKYRQQQIDGYKAAVGIKDAAQGQKDKAQKTTKDAPGVNKQGMDNDKTLTGSGKSASETGGKASQGQGKESEASSAGQEGASAAGTEVPDPPAPHWWDHILNAAKKFICNYIGKALKYVQDWFTNAIISLFTGGKLNLDKVNAMAKGVQQGTSEDANKSRQSAQQADQAGSKSQANEAKADEEMTEAQKLQQECQKNVASADDLLKTVDEVESLIKQEIEQGTKWLAEVKAAKEKEKQDLAAKEAQKQKEQEEKEKEAAKKAQDAANKKDAKDKDQASPEQLAKLSQAAQAVTAGSAANHQKVLKGFEAAKGALKGQGGPGGDKQLNHEAAESAIQVFEEHGREAVSNHQTETDQVRGKMTGVAGKSQIKRSELHGVVQEIEGAAKEADQTLGETLQSLKKAFDASYRLQKKQSHRKPAGDQQQRHQAQP